MRIGVHFFLPDGGRVWRVHGELAARARRRELIAIIILNLIKIASTNKELIAVPLLTVIVGFLAALRLGAMLNKRGEPPHELVRRLAVFCSSTPIKAFIFH